MKPNPSGTSSIWVGGCCPHGRSVYCSCRQWLNISAPLCCIGYCKWLETEYNSGIVDCFSGIAVYSSFPIGYLPFKLNAKK